MARYNKYTIEVDVSITRAHELFLLKVQSTNMTHSIADDHIKLMNIKELLELGLIELEPDKMYFFPNVRLTTMGELVVQKVQGL